MKIVIEAVVSDEDQNAMRRVRREVFERELGITLAPPEVAERNAIAHLLARAEPGHIPIGTLSLIDTSDNHQLHESLGLKFDLHAPVARYTHLAVLKPYRGMNVPLMMMLEAHRRLIEPRRIRYTWLLFGAERAPTSFLCRLLGFTPLPGTFISEYGCRRPLVKDEYTPASELVIRQAERFLKQSLELPLIEARLAQVALGF